MTSLYSNNFDDMKPITYEVWWDAENCLIPRDVDAIQRLYDELRHQIERCLKERFPQSPIASSRWTVPINIGKLPLHVQKKLNTLGVHISQVAAKKPNAADHLITNGIINCSAPALVVISGDHDFSTYIHEAKYKRHVIQILGLSHNEQDKTLAHQVLFYSHIARSSHTDVQFPGHSMVAPTKNEKERSEEKELKAMQRRVWISDVPADLPEKELEAAMRQKYTDIKRVVKKRNRDASTSYAFAFFRTEESFAQAVRDATFKFGDRVMELKDSSKPKPMEGFKEAAGHVEAPSRQAHQPSPDKSVGEKSSGWEEKRWRLG
ncbi:hypothetical protein PROFUN_10340 [Planoprotostelium fungivorum]|uniref:Meiosis regulator and mRNA stability factor 1 n=1 Tax=Planoprotostelium fungivorum TaxID=1890364 RepID=A0A2P6NDY6_9EUKA|nr:hypothetical protein PROFUN_10340 [Planoprotostelium fungivorum]